jgi:hypothetical protein
VCAPVTSTNQFNRDKSSATFKLVVASVSNNNALSFNDKSSSTFKLVVVSVINKFSNGPTNNSPAKQRPVSNDDPVIQRSLQLHVPMTLTFERSIEASSIFQLIVGSKQKYQRKPQQDLVNSSSSKTIIFETSNAFSRGLIVTFIKPNASQLIVASINSEISFHFWEDCRIFREGVKDDPAITMANHANSKLQLIVECLFLLRDKDNSETMTSSLLLLCVKDALAIMMAPFANFSLQLIVETPSLLLLSDFERPAITAVMNGSFSFKFIVASHSEGARFAPNFDRPSDLDSSKLIVIFLEISFQFCEDYRIFCEGEYQVKNDSYAIDKQ